MLPGLVVLLIGSIASSLGAVDPPRENSVDGYWLFRAPVDSVHESSGLSRARRNGPVLGNGRDVGVLWRDSTLDNENGLLEFESRHCAAWVQFYFDVADIETPGTIDNIYFHTWNYLENSALACDRHFGIAINESYDVCTYFREWPLDSSLAWPHGTAYHQLTTFYCDDLDFIFAELSEFWGVSYKVSGGAPHVISYPTQRSFCLVNIDDPESLQLADSDADGLSDFDELFVTFTDPYDQDTDDDGHDDYQEYTNNMCGWDPYDWGTTHIYHPDGVQHRGYVRIRNNQEAKPETDAFESTLDRELTSTEYASLTMYDGDYSAYPYESDTLGPWSQVQLNFVFDLPFTAEQISDLCLFQGGVLASYDLLEGEVNKAVELKNQIGGTNGHLPARFGHTPALSFRPFTDAANFVAEPDGKVYARVFTKNRLSDAELQLDFLELWVTVGSSGIEMIAPTQAQPVTVAGGETISIDFSFIEQDVTIISGLALDSVMIGSNNCDLVGIMEYTAGHWHQSVLAPALNAGECYELAIFAHTTSIDLSFTEPTAVCYTEQVLCGDADGDGTVNITDVVYLIQFIFADGPEPVPYQAGDANCDSTVNITDAVYLITYIFADGPAPCADCP